MSGNGKEDKPEDRFAYLKGNGTTPTPKREPTLQDRLTIIYAEPNPEPNGKTPHELLAEKLKSIVAK